jgi:uncharacterized protein
MMAVLRALVIGSVGGLLCHLAGLPAPWLAGSLIATIMAIYARQELALPQFLRTAAFILLGIQTGMAVNAETLERAARWPFSIMFLGVTVIVIVWASMVYYERFRRWDRATSLFASLPGALSLVILLASKTKADLQRVTISQCVRLFFLIAALPALITWISPAPDVSLVAERMVSLLEILVVLVASALAGLIFERFKVPAGLILGPAIVSASLGLADIIHGTTPISILIPANIILGVMIGLRFKGISFPDLRRALGDSMAAFLIALTIAAAGAAITAQGLDLPLSLTLLAFAPGGLEAMTIMAFALQLDPAYVAAHQVARYVGMVLVMPWVTAYLLKPQRE